MDLDDQKVDCGVLIALEEEFIEFLRVFQLGGGPLAIESESYYPFYFKDNRKLNRKGVAALIGKMGPEAAVLKTERLISTFMPDVIVNIGIAGAIDSELRAGDVVIAEEIDNYVYRGKISQGIDGEPVFRWGGSSSTSDAAIVQRIRQLYLDEPFKLSRWRESACARLEHIVSDSIRDLLIGRDLLREKPKIYEGALASGPFVVSAESFKEILAQRNRNYLAIEMESAGVMTAALARKDQPRCLIVRAISDFADERKQEFDRTANGVLRSWSMSNAVDLLAMILESVVDFASPQYPDAGRDRRVLPEDDLGTMVDELHRTILEKYVPNEYDSLLGKNYEELLAVYGQLFFLASSSDWKPTTPEKFIQDLAAFVRDSSSKNPMRVAGLPGTGKSSLLTLLYLHLHQEFRESLDSPIPVYLNLHHYDWAIGKSPQEDEIRLTCTRDLEPLLKIARQFPQRKIILLIDGVEEYVRIERTVEAFVLSLADKHIPNKKIIGLGLAENQRDSYFKRNTAHLGRFQAQITLEPLSIENPNSRLFVELFARATSQVSGIERALSTMRRFNLKAVDFLTLSLVFSSEGDLSGSGPGNFSAFLYQYCEELLRSKSERGGNTFSLAETGLLAYQYAIAKESIPQEEVYGDPRWKLIHRHSLVKDFLVGYHIIDHLKAIVRGETEDFSRFSHVFPHGINRAQKEIMNLDVGTQRMVLEGLRVINQRGPDSCRPHICYLAGRIDNPDLRHDAKKFLNQCKDEYFRKRKEERSSPTPKDLLLIRTIYISLVELGDRRAADEYITQLIRHPSWDNLNRGFHLEYYGDIPYTPGLDHSMTHDDRLDNCSKTISYLRSKILREGRSGSKVYPLMKIEIYTALSLAQHRHAKGVLSDDLRLSVLDLAKQLLAKTSLGRPVQQYCKMMVRHLERKSFGVGDIIEELYTLKRLPRSGWVKRGIKNPESVAEHALAAYFLGLLYLPPKWPQIRGYDKQEILNTILIHELAEAKIGDLLPDEKTEKMRLKEAEEFSYLGLTETYAGVFGLVKAEELWKNFQAGRGINAQIAKEIDKLENLVQLYLYRRAGYVITDYVSWERELIDAVSTEIGQGILEIVKSTFSEFSATLKESE